MTEWAPFFIVASARSGTTMLRIILNRHPHLAVPPESRFITELWQGDTQVHTSFFLDRLAAHSRFAAWDLPIQAVGEELGYQPSVGYREAISAAYRAYARSRGKERWGDKTPRYVEHIPFLAGLFPSSRFVHLVRDGRDVALSYADQSFGPKTISKSAHLWRKRVAAGLRDGRALGDKRYMELRYEDLVEDPEARLSHLCAFLGISFDPVMLEPDQGQQDVLARASTYNPHVTDRPKRGVRQWRTTMPDRQVEIFEAVAGGLLSQLSYPRVYPNPRLVSHVQAYLGNLGIPVGRAISLGRKIISRVTGKPMRRKRSP
jgi:hypothetical protein